MTMRFLATCPQGMTSLLHKELCKLGAESAVEKPSGVNFMGPLSLGYRACLWSRIANRVMIELADSEIHSADDLYDSVSSIPWSDHIHSTGSLVVDFSGQSTFIRNEQFGAQKVKDSIVDQFRSAKLGRPSVNKTNPDVRVAARLFRNRLKLGIDLSGGSLHKRGYRLSGGLAPLKENVCAAILTLMGWDEMCLRGACLIDPMCGSATLLLEGALIALDRAPGLDRNVFGFDRWVGHDEKQWSAIKSEAKGRTLSELPRGVEIRGYDSDFRAVRRSQENISRLGFEGIVRIRCKPLAHLSRPTHRLMKHGLLVVNPPWGGRMALKKNLTRLYNNLGAKMNKEFLGWQAAVVTSDLALGKSVGLRSNKQYRFQNGSVQLHCLKFDLNASNRFNPIMDEIRLRDNPTLPKSIELSDGAQMVANRLRKNLRRSAAWRVESEISCFRIYDADLPEYAAAVDVYEESIHVAEYAPPKEIPEEKADQRLGELLDAVQSVFDIPNRGDISVKIRRRQKGHSQYQRLASSQGRKVVHEGRVKLLVNLHDYLDTGLFLDHRPLRHLLAKESKGKHFLNLFSYTGAATIHAAMAGARSSISVDLSKTYLEWFDENLALNGLSTDQHRGVRKDVREWLAIDSHHYDLILLDPPSFSNSKGLNDFDVQKDHLNLIHSAMNRLSDNGSLYFSTNLRSFKLDQRAQVCWSVKNISSESIPKDFTRNRRIHQCWRFKRNLTK